VAPAFDAQLTELVRRLSLDHGKDVDLRVDLKQLHRLPALTVAAIKDTLIQLVRNALVHGIEAPKARMALDKPPRGAIEIELTQTGVDWQLRFRDDGAGIDPDRIRRALLERGGRSADDVHALSERELLLCAFEPGFSTAAEPGRDAGRGVGLDAVKAQLDRIGARLRLKTRPNRYTHFTIRSGA
jgi:two-component system chemotaxis sensor kinase CheA